MILMDGELAAALPKTLAQRPRPTIPTFTGFPAM
jgi:hypothetical protein